MSNSISPLVSIVTPVYNGEQYLEECIESVLAQTYNNFEYVILNNCSTDRTLEIANSYCAKDPRIIVHSNGQLLPLMANWNRALKLISSESKYCKVLHADDLLFPECVKKMVDLAEENDTVGLVGAYRIDEDRVNLDEISYPCHVTPGHEICRRRLLGRRDLFGSPSSVMYRSAFIHEAETFYSENNMHADSEVCFDILLNSDFGFVHQVLTYTRRHNESETTFTRKVNTHNFNHLYLAMKFGEEYLEDEERRRVLRGRWKVYYRMLGKSILAQVRSRQWTGIRESVQYQSRAFKAIGYKLSMVRVLFSLTANIYNFSLQKLMLR